MTATATDERIAPPETVGDLIARLGDVPPERIRLEPRPGTATEKDLLALLDAPDKVLCELVDGTLVEKPMGSDESVLAARILQRLLNFLDAKGLGGRVTGPDGSHRLRARLVRLPDVSYTTEPNVPKGTKRHAPISDWIPDLAVEVLSRSNRRAERLRKLNEYFAAGVPLVWFVDPAKRTIRVHTTPESFVELGDDDTLDGGDVLPGFSLSVRELFDSV